MLQKSDAARASKLQMENDDLKKKAADTAERFQEELLAAKSSLEKIGRDKAIEDLAGEQRAIRLSHLAQLDELRSEIKRLKEIEENPAISSSSKRPSDAAPEKQSQTSNKRIKLENENTPPLLPAKPAEKVCLMCTRLLNSN